MSHQQSQMFHAVGMCFDPSCRELKGLLAAGADPNAVCSPKYEFAPLHCVATQDHHDAGGAARVALQCLIGAGADVNVRDGEGDTPVMSAVEMGVVDSVRFFAAHGADLTLRNNAGKTAYDLAMDPSEGSAECAQALLELGFDPAAHPPQAAPARTEAQALVSTHGTVRGRVAFVGVPTAIYDADEVDADAARFYNGNDAHKLQTQTWPEGCDVYEVLPGSSQLDPERYTTVVIAEDLVAGNHNHAALQGYYRRGGRIVVIATTGVYKFPSDVLSPLFDVDWKFVSYTKHEFELTELGVRVVGDAAAGGTEYTKSNCLRVPSGESVLLPKHTFESAYGYALGDTTSEYYDAEDEGNWRAQPPPVDTPIALHVDPSHGGELAYVGLTSIMCSATESWIVEKLIRSRGQH